MDWLARRRFNLTDAFVISLNTLLIQDGHWVIAVVATLCGMIISGLIEAQL